MNKNSLEKRIERLISYEVLANQTHLVTELLLKSNPEIIEQIENLHDESSDAVEGYLICDLDMDEEAIMEMDVHERLDLAKEKGFVPVPHDIYEWWLVTDFLAEKLSEFEQPVLKTQYGTWWGRTTTGQAIKMDYAMHKITEAFEYS